MKVHFQFPAPITIAPIENPRLKNLFGNSLGAMFVSGKNKVSLKVPQLPLTGFSEAGQEVSKVLSKSYQSCYIVIMESNDSCYLLASRLAKTLVLFAEVNT